MPGKRGPGKKTLQRLANQAKGRKGVLNRGIGPGSRIEKSIAPESWEICAESRGNDGQIGLVVQTPNKSYKSFRAALEEEGTTSEKHGLNVSTQSDVSLYEPTEESFIAYESDGSIGDDPTSNSESEEDAEIVPEWLDKSSDIHSEVENELFIGETSAIFTFVTAVNKTSACASSPQCKGLYELILYVIL